jgi:hypothetical protein
MTASALALPLTLRKHGEVFFSIMHEVPGQSCFN